MDFIAIQYVSHNHVFLKTLNIEQAPGEAEAELAYLNKIHAIDLILTSDSDVFVFGATHIIRQFVFSFFGYMFFMTS